MAKRLETSKAIRMKLYAAARYLDSDVEEKLGLRIPFHVYLQDPLIAKEDPKFGFDEGFHVRWEPGISDGPTSSRFAVVDYNGDTEQLAPMAKWSEEKECFLGTDGKPLNKGKKHALQFHQVNVWALLQRALDFFEQGFGLGRPIPFGFEGNRLIVVPHAGYGQNAFYDRTSKSLQFYYFDDENGDRVYTCLSTDIINHEFGHAVLDGIRPHYLESSLVETAAFHEFIGDITAILIILRNNNFRGKLAEATGGNLAEAKYLSHIADQFGKAVTGRPYLRSARNNKKMSGVQSTDGPHEMSTVLTGAMFDILMELARRYQKDRKLSPKKAFWEAISRMQRMTVQPLDLLPPVDVTFRDYALAVLRAEEVANPKDPHGYVNMMRDIFIKREILDPQDDEVKNRPGYLFDRIRLDVYHDIDVLSRSKAEGYRFLSDNRDRLFIPAHQDVFVTDLYVARKLGRQASRMPRQIILEYIWREEVVLTGSRFGKFEGEVTFMLCGGTLVFDESGNLLSRVRKPGTENGKGKHWEKELEEGKRRREKLLDNLAQRIAAGQVGATLGSSKGLLGSHIAPLTVKKEHGVLHFALSPHLHLFEEDHEKYTGGRQWEISS